MVDDISQLDLRHYIDYVQEVGGSSWLEIDRTISPRWETTALVQQLARKMRSPVIKFRSVAGSTFPMVSNVSCSFERVAKSAGSSGAELQARLAGALHGNRSPVTVAGCEAPVRERIKSFSEFSLHDFPQLFYTSTQTHAYITSAIVVARDPDSGAHNLSFHRLMICGTDIAAIYMTPGGHLHQIWSKNSAGGNPTAVSVVIGVHPLWCYGALASGPLDHDDYAVVSALLGESLALASGALDSELLVPARAEMVLDGFIDPVAEAEEGPFGEFLGFVAERAPAPVIKFETASFRNDAIFQDIVAGEIEHLTMSTVTLRARLTRDYFGDSPAVVDFWLPAAMTIFLSIDTGLDEAFDCALLMSRLLAEQKYIKQVVCFDSDVDLRKQLSVQSALACNVQPDRDIRIISGCDGNGVDPSEINAKTSKLSIDARAKKQRIRNELPADFLANFELNDWL